MSRELFLQPALEVAPLLLGAHIAVDSPEGRVRLRITEVEAYHGVGVPGPYDAGSHSRDRMTARNASMFGEHGHAYVYFTYGMHYALNLVCSPEGTASGVLLRAGKVVEGLDLARDRRYAKRGTGTPLPDHQIARGPGNLAAALGVDRERHDGLDLFSAPFEFEPRASSPEAISSGPRVGVSGEAGGPAFPWRFWLTGDQSVSAYKPGKNVPR